MKPVQERTKIVRDQSELQENNWIYFFSPKKKREVKAFVLAQPQDSEEGIFIVQEENNDTVDLIDIKEMLIFKILETPKAVGKIQNAPIENSLAPLSPSCECGAKFTSNPNFHLNYCSFK